MVTLPIVIDQAFARPAKLQAELSPSQVAVYLAHSAFAVALCLGFGAAFWWNTRAIVAGKPSRSGILLLVFQLTMSLFFPEAMFIVAAELPFMMPIRVARQWLAVQCALLLALTVLAVATRHFVPADSLLHVPWGLSVPGTVLYMLAWTWFAFGAGCLAVSEARNLRELARVHAELLATQMLLSDETRLAERIRISRELHDVVGHHLAGLSINLQLASHLVEGPAIQPVDEAYMVAKLLLAEVREVVGDMRESRQSSLRSALELLCHGIPEPRLHLQLTGPLERIDPVSAHILFRSAQEAITNAIKHGGARNLWVQVQPIGAAWELRVRDDGQGCAHVSPGNGLRGMRERLEEIGGRLHFLSEPGKGFILQAQIGPPAESL